MANFTIKISTDRLNEVKAENESLKQRINELESDSFQTQPIIKHANQLRVGNVIVESGMFRTITEITFIDDQYKVLCGGWIRWYEKNNPVAVVPSSFDIDKQKSNDPVLDTARMMATAANWLKGKNGYHFATTVVETYSGIAEPYKLRETETNKNYG